MPVPSIIDDGNFKVAQQNGAIVPNFPFAYRGDNQTFVAKRTMRIDVDFYVPPVPMSQLWFNQLGTGYLVDFDQPVFVGQRLIEYGEIYASVPITGKEYGTATYTFQYPNIEPPISITSYTDTFSATRIYEYSIFEPLPQLTPSQLIISNIAGVPTFLQTGNWSITDGENILAQPSASRIYRGQIYERETVFVNPPAASQRNF